MLLIDDTGVAHGVMAAETAADATLDALNGDPSTRLVLSAGRALALGLDGAGPVALRLAPPWRRDRIEPLADPLQRHDRIEPSLDASPADPVARAALSLTKLAQLLPAALVFAAGHGREEQVRVEIDAINRRAGGHVADLVRVSQAEVPLADAEDARIIAFRPTDGGAEHLAIVIGAPEPGQPVLVRVHSACVTGDLLGSLRCDCGDQLRAAIKTVSEAGSGVVLYLAQEGRGIGIANKLRAYTLQDQGLDTVEANEQLGFDADERRYGIAAAMLRDLAIARVRLMTNNPDKLAALASLGIDVVERVPLIMARNVHNQRYLDAKASRAGHLL